MSPSTRSFLETSQSLTHRFLIEVMNKLQRISMAEVTSSNNALTSALCSHASRLQAFSADGEPAEQVGGLIAKTDVFKNAKTILALHASLGTKMSGKHLEE